MRKTFKGKVIVMALCAVSAIALNSCSRGKTAAHVADEISGGEQIVRAIGSDFIRLNQLGYYPNAPKVAVVIGGYEDTLGVAEKTTFSVVRVNDNGERAETVLRGELSDEIEWTDSGERGRRADFTGLTTAGKYMIVLGDDINEKVASHVFEIRGDVFRDVAKASMRTFYYQRCSAPLDEELVGEIWARPAGHPDTAVSYHASTGRGDIDKKLYSPGGWYDAGDFGKYIVNSGITMGTLLAFYEMFPDYFPDNSLNIPESGNGLADILDEMKFNLDWMITMQDEDGGVYNKLTTLVFPGYIMPHEDDGERFAIGKSTTSALNFAAVMAQTARVYAATNEAYANDALDRARRAWEWAKNNPDIEFKNPDDVKTGEYGDKNFYDEFTWAAAELLITTGEEEFAEFLRGRDLEYKRQPTWQYVNGLAALSLASTKNNLDDELREVVKSSILSTADRWLDEMDAHLYRLPQMKFEWGSNSSFANVGIAMIYAYLISNDEKYLQGASEIADYILGKNAMGVSFMTAFGSRFAANPHHRQVVAAMGIEGWDMPRQLERQTAQNAADIVIPGFLVGGPNPGHQDSAHGVTYSSSLPAKSYEDNYKSYASNEVAINWNAPSTFLLGALDVLFNR